MNLAASASAGVWRSNQGAVDAVNCDETLSKQKQIDMYYNV
jgi:hypothetical protein